MPQALLKLFFFDGEKINPTTVGDNCYIGSGAIMIAPLVLEDGSYVNPGAIVTGDKVDKLEQGG